MWLNTEALPTFGGRTAEAPVSDGRARKPCHIAEERSTDLICKVVWIVDEDSGDHVSALVGRALRVEETQHRRCVAHLESRVPEIKPANQIWKSVAIDILRLLAAG